MNALTTASPAVYLDVEAFMRRVKATDADVDDGRLFRIDGFIFADATDASGFVWILSSTNDSAEDVGTKARIDTRKIASWPPDVVDGSLVQVVGHADGTGTDDLSAVSIVKVGDMNTVADMKMLQESFRRMKEFLEAPRPNILSLTERCDRMYGGEKKSNPEKVHDESSISSAGAAGAAATASASARHVSASLPQTNSFRSVASKNCGQFSGRQRTAPSQ